MNIEQKRSTSAEEYTIEDILQSFRTFDGEYKREQVDAALRFKEEITPHLITILENALAEPERYVEDENLYEHIYAVMLLGHFREPKAHNVIVDLFSLTDNVPSEMFGDITASGLDVILLNTCAGSVDSIKSLVLNKAADEYCRSSACYSLAYAVIEGHVSRELVIDFFRSIFNEKESHGISDFWGLLASVICDFYPEEMMVEIKQAYEDELIMPGIVQYSDFENALELGKDKCLEKLKADLERHSLDNIHEAMSWWACFNKPSKSCPSFSSTDNHNFSGYSGQVSSQSKKKKRRPRKRNENKRKLQRKRTGVNERALNHAAG